MANGNTDAIGGRVESHRFNVCTIVLKNTNLTFDPLTTLGCPAQPFLYLLTALPLPDCQNSTELPAPLDRREGIF
jgi:hypothetical protein